MMNLVFMNSLERKGDDGHIQSAQVLIQEEEGRWLVSWLEADEQGKQVQDEWYEGSGWDEMLAVFRYKLSEKLASGYMPLLNGMFESNEAAAGRSKLANMLSYYCEMNKRDDVYEAMRKWRLEQASKEGKAAYLVFTNRVLRMLSTFLPQNKEEMVQIPGIGEKKAQMYGDALFAMTTPLQRSHTFPLDWVYEQIDHPSFERWVYKQKEEKYKQEIDRHDIMKKLLQGIQDVATMDELAATVQMSRRDVMLSLEQLDQDGYDLSVWLEKELATMPAEERKKAWRAFEELGDRYLKPILQKVYSEEELAERPIDEIYEKLRMIRIQFRKHIEKKTENKEAS